MKNLKTFLHSLYRNEIMSLRVEAVRQILVIVLAFLLMGLMSIVSEGQDSRQLSGRTARAEQRVEVQQVPLPALGQPPEFGVYINGNQMAQDVNSSIGAGSLDIMGIFEHWKPEGISSVNKLESICSGGYIPLISWESWGGKGRGIVYELNDIAEGDHDPLILNYFRELRDICGEAKIIIRFNHEMEMRPTYGFPWTPWQGKPQEYVAAWKHVVNLARSNEFTNLKWLWSPNRADQYVLSYYPGGEYVDYVGMTLNHPTITGLVYNSFEQFYLPNKRILESFEKPIIIGEAAYYNIDENQIASWINGTFKYVKNDKRIVALVWFNQGLGHLNYNIEATAMGRRAFIDNMRQVH